MLNNNRLLSVALVLFGVTFCLIYPLAMLWPSGWAWHEGSPVSSHYFMMIVGIYATLGIFMICAAKNPTGNRSLIWFVIWSSIVHAGVMGLQALGNGMHRGHLTGDVPALLIVAAVLALLMRRVDMYIK
ncbi:unnamed protein product [Commensalibacter communis]|uniref:DUF6632 domain-containing protein n=1 Tax=Commensalibacter communis TaxID=2972786 RepID=UPI0022FFA9FD|nr:DUF6632 domain-containing protein [Commensalibacter communis]CAI3923126.1 unnamed protein product [Commensalibacter communis]